jgi:hypothetical protein
MTGFSSNIAPAVAEAYNFAAFKTHKVLRQFTLAGNASPGQYQAEIGSYLGNAALTGKTPRN